MRRIGRAGYPFVALGVAFIAIGASGRRSFIAIGLVFLAIGLLTLRRG
jgi:hypothetical protein